MAFHSASRRREILSAMERTAIDLLPEPIYVNDSMARKTLANRANFLIMGLQAEAEAVGKAGLNVFPAEIAARFWADDQAVMRTGEPLLNREEITVTRHGQQRWRLTSKAPLRDSDGHIKGLMG